MYTYTYIYLHSLPRGQRLRLSVAGLQTVPCPKQPKPGQNGNAPALRAAVLHTFGFMIISSIIVIMFVCYYYLYVYY